MISKAFQDCLLDVYHGEMAGEAAFEAMLGQTDEPDQRFVLATLLQFETEGKARLRPLLMRLGLSLRNNAEAMRAAAAGVDPMKGIPWAARFAAMGDVVKRVYLPRYLELATLVTPDADPEAARIAAFMGQHERALIKLTENVVAGIPILQHLLLPCFNFQSPRHRAGDQSCNFGKQKIFVRKRDSGKTPFSIGEGGSSACARILAGAAMKSVPFDKPLINHTI